MDATANTHGDEASLGNIEQDAPILVILDDDCLLEIFRQLDFEDLSNVASVCIRFNQNAKKIYSKNYRARPIRLPVGDHGGWLVNFG